MCGISGIFNNKNIKKSEIDIVKSMNFIQRHRGPDDEGMYISEKCVLGHRRLSIIDLSKDGHQPFCSSDGRYSLVFNGEIYNYIELREELKQKGVEFRTKTDTEVLLKCYQAYGKDCLSKLNGMFAFAIYDKDQDSLFLARDRVGIKPLYYICSRSKLYFASEIKSFRAIPDLKSSLNKQVVFDYFVFNRTNLYDETFLNEIKKVPKGHYGVFDKDGLNLTKWWSPEEFVSNQNNESQEQILKDIEEILVSSVKLRLRSDVTVGSCLSGGLDSSIILGILSQHKLIDENYSTFTASFPGFLKDESSFIEALGKTYDFKNYKILPRLDAAFESLDKFVYAQDEPCLSASYYAQYEVMKKAKEEGVTVLLDGQGGDENFAGYQYLHGFYLYGLLKRKQYKEFMNGFVSLIVRKQNVKSYQALLYKLLPRTLKKYALLSSSQYLNKEFFDYHVDRSIVFNKFMEADNLNASLAQHFQYKLEHLLNSEDKNSMAFSVEARVPYLDHRLIEYVLGVSEKLKISKGETKYLQKKALGKYTISEILNRKDKVGFDAPQDAWMKQKSWQKLAVDSYEDLSDALPEIFKRNKFHCTNAGDRWKLIQLSKWKKVFLN
ncbi:MAG: asparagine synthase (glutamine-hydrolyzing) [Candidatus Zapsychrus exili]|nr:asparagine synthase (glutamine-hydrolyzing) [Candidatus Zapsychrus exili]